MPLPLPVIDLVFNRLAAIFGRQFFDLYADLDPATVKTAWGHELAVFGDTEAGMERIWWALDNLPDRPPNAVQFRNLCRQAPVVQPQPLPAPPPNPARVRAELEKLGYRRPADRVGLSEQAVDHKAWARALIERANAGERLRPTVLLFARQALGLTRESAPMRGSAT